MLLGNKKDCLSSFWQVPTRDGRHVECEWEGTEEEGRREVEGGRGGRWREVEEGGGGREEQRNIVSSSLGEVVCMCSIAHYSVL